MRPAFDLLLDGASIRDNFAGRLTSMTITDGDEEEADTLAIELDARGHAIELPETGVTLTAALGFEGAPLVEMGAYTVDQVSGSGPVLTLSITATAVDMTRALRAPRVEAYEEQTLDQIAARIAARGGLIPAVDPVLKGLSIAFEAQRSESDIAFITRLARRFDAIAKPAGGRLLITPRDKGRAVDGSALPAVTLPTRRLTEWDWDQADRSSVGQVKVDWRDVDRGQRETVSVGDGDPAHHLRRVFASEDSARRAAQAELDGKTRGRFEINATIAGFEPNLFSGGLVQFPDIYPGVSGQFLVKQVTHRLEGSLVTTLRAETSQKETGG